MTATIPTTPNPSAGGYTPPQPNAFQNILLGAPLDEHLFAGTAKGVGKSFGILFLVLRDSQILRANYHALILRSTYQSLQEVQGILFRHLTQLIPGTRYVAAENMFYLGGKSAPFGTVELAYTATSALEQVRALARLQGRSQTTIIADEVGNVPDSSFFDQLMGVLRAAPGTPTRAIFLCNPGGAGNYWLKQRFVDPVAPLEPMRPRRFWSEEYERHVISLTATAASNPHIDWEGYKRNVELMAGGDPALLDALLRGVWSEIGGGFFQHCWSPTRCRVPIIPGSINLRDHHPSPFAVFDWGTASPTVGYIVVPNPPNIECPKGSLLLADEVYLCHSSRSGRDWSRGAQLSNAQQASIITDWLFRWKLTPADLPMLVDDAIFASNGSPNGSVAGDFRRAGIRFRPVGKSSTPEVGGLVMLKNRMLASQKDWTQPWLLWSQVCEGWEATIPSISRHPRDPETIADTAVNHALDAARYAVAYFHSRWKTGSGSIRLW